LLANPRRDQVTPKEMPKDSEPELRTLRFAKPSPDTERNI
jgi:hypothetical protein